MEGVRDQGLGIRVWVVFEYCGGSHRMEGGCQGSRLASQIGLWNRPSVCACETLSVPKRQKHQDSKSGVLEEHTTSMQAQKSQDFGTWGLCPPLQV
jgi:hypothetical protein